MVTTEDKAVTVASGIGYPITLKGSGAGIAHKTEMNLIELDLRNEDEVGPHSGA